MNPPRPRKSLYYSNYFYLFPAFLFYLIFVLYPLTDTIYTSFTQWSGIGEKTWVGLENYKNNLADKKITSSIKHSFILIIFYSFFPIIIGLGIAGMMVRIKVRGMATDCAPPTARNSNLSPVKANGEVRLRSVLSCMR